jgi:UDP-N-acetylmuramoyl-tripeptide--D-alanyl-D-alanine ligase
MRRWQPARLARAAGARLVAAGAEAGAEPGPTRASVDSRTLAPEELFVGLRGERSDGGEHAAEALAAGAWGVLVAPEHAQRALAAGALGVVLAHPQPLRGLHALARAWREELGEGGTRVVAITGSTGKTSTKDILAALLSSRLRVVASPENLNTEIGMPLAMLAAPAGTELLVLEMAMRGAGQIAELTSIAHPDVGVIVNVGPVHLELLGSLPAIAAAKAELIAGLGPDARLVVPASEPLLQRHLRADLQTITFGPGGDVSLAEPELAEPEPVRARGERDHARRAPAAHTAAGEVLIRIRAGALPRGGGRRADAEAGEALVRLRPSFAQAHNLRNLLAAVAAARALGITPEGELRVSFSSLRGERLQLPGGVVLINDCYNANPMSMHAAIDDLAETASARRVAVLGDMLELGDGAREFHRQVGEHAAKRGIELLVTVGALAAEIGAGFGVQTRAVPNAQAAAEILPGLLRAGDTVLVKGSRGVGLELIADVLRRGGRTGARGEAPLGGLVAGPRSG